MFNKIKENSVFMSFSSFQLLYQLSISIVVPFFSLLLLNANWTTEQITYFFAISSFVIFLFGPAIGRIADLLGKRTVILFGLILQILFFIIYFFFLEYVYFILIARVIEVIAVICISLVGISAIEDFIKDNRGFWMGLFLSIGTIGALIGPVIAGSFSSFYSIRFLFIFAVILTLISLFFLFKLPNNKTSNKNFVLNDLNPLNEIKHFLIDKKLKGMAVLGIFMNSKVQFYAIFFPILITQVFNYPNFYLGIFLTIPVFFHIFQFYFGRLSDSISSEFGVLFGVSMVSISLFFFPYISNIYSIFILLILYGIGGSIWNVSAWSLMGEIAEKKGISGEIVTTYASISKLGVFISTLLSATLISIFTLKYTFQFYSIILLFAVVISYFFLKPVFHHEKQMSYFHILKK